MLSFFTRQRATVLLSHAAGICLFFGGLSFGPGLRAQALAQALQPFVDAQQMAGAVVLVGTADRVLATETVGWRDRVSGDPMRADTIFWIASQTKPITAAAVLMLVDEGKIRLEDPVSTYLPDFKDSWVQTETSPTQRTLRPAQSEMRVRDLLMHTSGLPARSPIETPSLDLIPLATLVRSYSLLPLSSDPGTKYLYSNPGINTAGRLVEVVSGLPFDQFLEQRLFQPLAMKDTTFRPTSAQQARLAQAYLTVGNQLEAKPIDALATPYDSPQRYTFPGGGLFSTAQDVYRFYQMLGHGGKVGETRLLSEKAVNEMTRKHTTPETGGNYGLGFAVGDDHFGHGGAYGTQSRYFPKTGLITIFLVQQVKWSDGGEKAFPSFLKAAADHYAPGTR